MKKGSGKTKGSAFERIVCARLSLWVSGGLRKDLFWRSAISGGRATRRHQKGEQVTVQVGDICAVDPLGHTLTDPFYIECKHYKDLRLGTFILMNAGPLAQFWVKTKLEAAKYKKMPMLIAKQNMYPTFVLIDRPTAAVVKWGVVPRLETVSTVQLSKPQHCTLVLFDDLLSLDFSHPNLRRTR